MVGPESLIKLVSDKKLIPYGIVAVIVYVSIWMTRVEDHMMTQASEITETQKAQSEYNRSIQRLDKKISIIGYKMKVRFDDDHE